MSSRRLAGAATAALLALVPAAHADRAKFDTRLFAKVPAPGSPEGLAISADQQRIYASTYQTISGNAQGPSKIFAYNPLGHLIRTYTLEGQHLDGTQGAGGIAIDADGLLYVINGPPVHIDTIDPDTGDQVPYATFSDVPSCAPGVDPAAGQCSQSLVDEGPLTPDPVFGPDGTIYASDTQQALIWRIPRGGGPARVWFSDARFTGQFAINKLRVAPDGRSLLFTETSHENPSTTDEPTGTGAVWRLAINPDGSAGRLTKTYQSQVGQWVDGLELLRDGNMLISLIGSVDQVVELTPTGAELGRTADPTANAAQPTPMDAPSSIEMLGNQLIVCNASFFTGNPDHWALLDVYIGTPGQPPFHPRVLPTLTRPRPSLRVQLLPDVIPRRRTVRVTALVTARTAGRWRAVQRANVRLDQQRRRVRNGVASFAVRYTTPGRHRVIVNTRLRTTTATLTVR